MNKLSKLVITVILCIILSFNPSTIIALTNTSIIATNNNTATISPLKESTTGSTVKVVATFYPIFEFVEQVGGDRVEVSTLIPMGVEPHDFEPTIQQIQNAERAGSGFAGCSNTGTITFSLFA